MILESLMSTSTHTPRPRLSPVIGIAILLASGAAALARAQGPVAGGDPRLVVFELFNFDG